MSAGTPIFDHDVACRSCGYNLRGLVEPRCPECGQSFVPAQLIQNEPAPMLAAFVQVCALLFLALALFLVLPPLALLGFFVVACFLVSALQAGLEVIMAKPLLASIRWRVFRAWWEAILIGYGVSGATYFFFGKTISVFETGSWRANLEPVFLLTAAEALVVKYFVLRARSKRWQLGLAPKRLAVACVLTQAVSQGFWLLLPFRIVRIP